jgi:uncharacterized membrane protein YfcA
VKDFLAIKTIGLLCNLVVVSGGSYLFYKRGYFDGKRYLPFALSGVPLAFYGATFQLSYTRFFIALGCVLTLSGLLLLLQILLRPARRVKPLETPVVLNVLLGAGIGFLSGLVGIGGGILLSPVLNLIRWDEPKKIAALATFFIFVNSIAGLTGQLVSGTFSVISPAWVVLLLAVLLGGQVGTRVSIHAIRPAVVKGLTGILICYIGAKLILKYTSGVHT